MAVVPPPPVQPSPRPSSASRANAAELIDQRIAEACRALWWAEFTRAWLRLVLVSIGIVLAWVVVDHWIYSPGAIVRWSVAAALLAALVWYLATRVAPLLRSIIRPEYAARSLERDLPELRQSLTSYVTLNDDADGATLPDRVVRSMGAATARKLQTYDALPAEATGTFRWWIACAVALALLAAYVVLSPKNSLRSASRLAAPFAKIDPAYRVSIRDVRPGDAPALAGRAIEVSAVVSGLREDESVRCRWSSDSDRSEMPLTLDQPTGRYVGDLTLAYSVSGDVQYWIEAGDAMAGPFSLSVDDVPVVALESVRYEPPAYTGRSPYTSRSGSISALEGTRVTIAAKSNRPVTKAKIEFNPRVIGSDDGSPLSTSTATDADELVRATAGAVEMTIGEDGTSLTVSFQLKSGRGTFAAVERDSYRISVENDLGQRNPRPIIYPIEVATDLPPEIAIMVPAKSPKNLPINSQQVIEVHASDPDFGLRQVALEIRSGIDQLGDPVLWSHPDGLTGNRVAEYRLRPTAHGLRVGDTVEVVAVATDNRELDDRSIGPNVSRSDPVVLRIVASQALPDEDDPNGDGVFDNAADDQSQQGENGNASSGGSDGDAEQSQSGAGSSDSGKGQSGQEDSQEQGDSGGSNGSSESDATGEQSPSEGSGDGRQSGDDSSADRQDGTGTESNQRESNGGDDSSGSGEPSAQERSTDADSTDEGGTSSDSQARDTPPGQQSTEPTSGESAGDSKAATERQRDGTPSDRADAAGDDMTSGDRDPSGDASGQGSEDRQGSEDGSREQADSDDASRGEQPQSGDTPAEDSRPPKHDGEAFERIRDHLNEMRERAGGDAQPNRNGEPSQPDGQSNDASGDRDRRDPSAETESSEAAASQDGQPGEQAGDGQEGQRDRQSDSTSNDDSATEPTESDTGEGKENSQQQSGQEGRSEGEAGGSEQSESDQSQRGEGQPSDADESSNTNPDSESGGDNSESDPSGESNSNSPQQGDSGSAKESQAESGSDANSTPSENDAAQPSGRPSESSQQSDQTSPSDPSSAESNASDGSGSSGPAEGGDSPVPPDPANLEYAKEATDMVLDYLKETREQPDPELLNKLNWTEDDLKRFADRWNRVRELDQPGRDPSRIKEMNDALKSLGLRPEQPGENRTLRESADTLRSIRDAGNRRPPPAAYRDQFDAFRRAINRRSRAAGGGATPTTDR